MLELKIPMSPEGWDDEKQEFVEAKTVTLQLEHSLESISKWESKYNKVYLSRVKNKTPEEILDYIRFMTLTPNVDPIVYDHLSVQNMNDINDYISAKMTATYFSDENNKGSTDNEEITSELMYYWMIALNIPFECQKWHLKRLTTLIQVCQVKMEPPKKHSRQELLERNAALNAKRRKELKTKG